MPAERRAPSFAAAKPVKTERTHEENQERAYIAASRRSDRSLEARIESARRASEIHKKRTGRALRVTEQDVVNEEMYEEEDDDLPTQYQRLNAHLQTSSWLFNRKLHDYIATQHGVRNMFLNQQFPGHTFQPYSPQIPQNGQSPIMNQSMMPPHTFNPSSEAFAQPPMSFSPTFQQQQQQQQQQQGYRHAPYNIPQRTQSHQRSASISTPLAMPNTGSAPQQPSSNVTTPRGEISRRLSLPPQPLEHVQHSESQSRPALSRTSTAQSGQHQSSSPQRGAAGASSGSTSGHVSPGPKAEQTSPIDYSFASMPFNTSSQVLDMNPLSMSLPPESQQFVGSALDARDPRTSIFMSGSENLAQPFMGNYTYNPNLSPKSSRAPGKAGDQFSLTSSTLPSGMTLTLAPENPMKLETSMDNSATTSPPSGMMDSMFTTNSLYTPNAFEYSNYFDQQNDGSRAGNDVLFNEQFEENSFVNWDQ